MGEGRHPCRIEEVVVARPQDAPRELASPRVEQILRLRVREHILEATEWGPKLWYRWVRLEAARIAQCEAWGRLWIVETNGRVTLYGREKKRRVEGVQ